MAEYSSLMLEVCQLLGQHGWQMTIRELANALDADADEVRRQVTAYADLDSAATLDAYMADRTYLLIDPADPYEEDPPPSDDDTVTLNASPTEILGIEQFDATVLGPLYQAAEQLLLQEPGNETLQDAAAILRHRFLPGVRRPRHFNAPKVAELNGAIEERRRVRIVYSRAWNPGVTERIIEPYALNHSSRGAEVDAGPLDEDGRIRTFLVNRVREIEVLDETFERPEDAAQRCLDARELTAITGYVPHSGRWAVDKWAERVEVGSRDAGGLMFIAHVLPPVEWRCALILLMAGPEAYLEDAELDQQKVDLAQRLLAHHGLG